MNKLLVDLEAEENVLGSMMECPDCIGEVIGILGENPKVFYKTAHQVIYNAIIEMTKEGEPVDCATVGSWLKRHAQDGVVGDLTYLYDLVAGVPTAANVSFYARCVKERAMRRRLVEIGREIVRMAHDEEMEVDEAVDVASQRLVKLLDGGAEDVPSLRSHLILSLIHI